MEYEEKIASQLEAEMKEQSTLNDINKKKHAQHNDEEAKRKTAEAQEEALRARCSTESQIDQFVGDASILSEVLEVIKSKVGGANAYIGMRETIKDEDDADSERIKYIATTKGNEFMLKETLKAGQGITWEVFKVALSPSPMIFIL